MTPREQAIIAAIDAANAADPERIDVGGESLPAALVYGQRMSATLMRFRPDASEHLLIAARGQHIERWTSPRKSYPEGRAGYLRWRNDLKVFHARRLGELMAAAGYGGDDIARVGALVRKEHLRDDAEAQALEDVACAVFIEHYFSAFEEKSDPAKLADILAKSWRKMSPAGHDYALRLTLPPHLPRLLEQGLARLGAGRRSRGE
ncbi:MAG: DUF4202 domain-containing protein [Xanthobacteraceae bacterium]|nr:MAG: DUF4202 domain-containing protein [Xanthobacteraceae bacterium]